MKRPVITFTLLGAIILLLAHSMGHAQTQKAPWYTAYYATWNQATFDGSSWQGEHLGQPPDQVDWTGITHVVHFGNGNVVGTPPYSLFATDSTEIMYGANGGSTDYQKLLITSAHSHGVKVLLSIQAVDPSGLHVALASQSSADVFAEWLVLYARRHGYDGFEIDWEGETPNPTLACRLILTLRAHLNAHYGPTRALILLSPGLNDGNSYTPAVCDTAVDQYNIQTYAMIWSPNNTNHTWHVCPVYPGTAPSGEDDQALDGLTDGSTGDVQEWINDGHDPSKVGLLLNTFGYFFIGADGLFQSWSKCLGHNGSMTVTQNSMLTGLLNVGGTLTWDAARQSSYISGTATAAYGSAEYGGVAKGQKFFAPLATPAWINAVVTYYKSKTYGGKTLGGLSLYSLTEDFDPSKPAGQGRNIIHDALRDALGGKAGPVLPTGTLTVSPAALPFGGGNVTLTWTSTNATAASFDHSIGSVPLNGTKTVSVEANTTFCLTLTDSAGSATCVGVVTVSSPIVSPKPGSKNQSTTPVIRWRKTPGATRYQLQVSSDSLFASTACNDSSLSDTVRQVGPLNKSVKYFSRVRAMASGAWGEFSSPAAFTTGTVATPIESEESAPTETALRQNYPNPFNPATAINYQLAAATHVTLKVYDVLGQEVETLVEAPQSAGTYSVTWNAAGRSSGVYLFRLTTGGYSATRRMVLLK